MSTSKHIDKICLAAVALSLVLTILFMCGGSLGLSAAAKTVKYEKSLFDSSCVHRIDIVMDDWDSFLERCENEEYANCTVVVDGKKHANIAIRAKGNTSLSSVKSMGSQRYSFKLEFDHNESARSLDGLDKLCLNNLIQDNTMMKDYLVYRMMADFGADAPLCSFAYLTVNGEDWGLYLAVEGVEDSFLARNYGSDTGELYKPDSMSFGGGRGNGKDFRFDDLDFDFEAGDDGVRESLPQDSFPGLPGGDSQQGGTPPVGQTPGQQGTEGGFIPDFPGGFPGLPSGDSQQGGTPPAGQTPGQQDAEGGFPPGSPRGFGGMGSDDVKLKYIDDEPDSYPNIFSSAKTELSEADRQRLIAALKQLSTYSDLEKALDIDEVLRYFVVHNFVVNGDSYTGSMIHNYYLHEKDGKLGMIPWDYNLAFGSFQGGNAASSVNASIDSPISGSLDDRPMMGWIFSDKAYTEQYHALFGEFIGRWFAKGELETLITETAELIRPYVEKDPSKFCTTEEFEAGVAALSQFVTLRAEAVSRQLDGDGTIVETGDLNLSDMGSMGGRGGMPGGKNSPEGMPGEMPEGFTPADESKGQMPAPPERPGGAPPVGMDERPSDGFSGDPPVGSDGNQPEGAVPPERPEGSSQAANPEDAAGPGTDEEAASAQPGESSGRPSRGRPQGSFPAGSGESGASPSPGGDGFSPGSAKQEGAGTGAILLLLGASVLVLAAGLLTAAKKRF